MWRGERRRVWGLGEKLLALPRHTATEDSCGVPPGKGGSSYDLGMKLKVLAGEKFSCHGCGDCCRDWHVELVEGEERRLTGLSWPSGDELAGKEVILRHGGRAYLTHRADGSCVYLNLENGRCRVHEAFGAGAKPAGCRLFPFNVVRTVGDEATVTARYDCPSVQKNVGAGHAEAVKELEGLVKVTGAGPGFDEATMCMLDLEQVEAVAEFASAMLGTFKTDAEKAYFLLGMCNWLEAVTVGELDREMLAGAYPMLRNMAEGVVKVGVPKPGAGIRLSFRMLWGMYLRRDEDVLNGRAGRFGRAAALGRVAVLGMGGIRGLGLKNPEGSIGKAKLFTEKRQAVEPGAFDVHWRMVRNKLESLQFMGGCNYGRNLLGGIRSLVLLYPLVAATARVRAGGRAVNAEDVRAGVAAIEHAFGRAPMLALPPARSLEEGLIGGAGIERLVGWA
jgi:lysine-N-methylase